MEYADDQVNAIYELGRLYFEMGFFGAAERVFSGLLVVDGGRTPARLALALTKLERGLFQEAAMHLRLVIQNGAQPIQAKLALAGTFIALGELQRAKTMLGEIAKETATANSPAQEGELRTLWEAMVIRCG